MIQKENGQQASTSHDAAREKIVRKVTWVGLLANLFLAGFKFIAGISGRSQALSLLTIHRRSPKAVDDELELRIRARKQCSPGQST